MDSVVLPVDISLSRRTARFGGLQHCVDTCKSWLYWWKERKEGCPGTDNGSGTAPMMDVAHMITPLRARHAPDLSDGIEAT